MATRIAKSIAAAAFLSLAVSSIAVASLALTTGSAMAKSNNNSGGSGGNSGNKSESPGSSASDNKSNGPQGNSGNTKIKPQNGRNAGKLKKLNKAHSPTAEQGYQNANTNSNVRQIATLKEVVSLTTSAKNDLESAQLEMAAHLDENPDLTTEEIDALVAKSNPESDSYDPSYVPSDLEAKTLDLAKRTRMAQANYDDMTASFEEALIAASGGRVLSDGALEYFKTKLGF